MSKENRIGIIRGLDLFFKEGIEKEIDRLVSIGIETVQIIANDLSLMTDEKIGELRALIDGKLEITSVWAYWMYGCTDVWDFVDGPDTLGIVPEAYRGIRLEALKKCADYAEKLGVHNMATHFGFIPEQPSYANYRGVVSAIRGLAQYCAAKDISLNFETGQETPTTLMRVIQDTGMDNLGVNLDPANLIMYGRANPIDALGIYGSRIKGVHIKDGDYPKDDFYKLGKERVVGEGSVNFPVFLPKLLKSGYKGDLYIEREITGEQQFIDIEKTVLYIKGLRDSVK